MFEKAKWPMHMLGLFLLLTGAAALVMPRGYSLGFYGICFFGLLLWLGVRTQLIDSTTKRFALPVLVYAAGHLLLGLLENFAWRSLDPVLPFGLMVFGLWALRRYRPSAAWFWVGLALGTIGAAGISGYQAIKLGARADGFTHAIQFGNIALLFGVLCMVRALATLQLSWLNLLLWMGFACGVVASIWSQARGGWVAIVLIFGWVFLHALKARSWFKRVLALAVLIGCMALPVWQLDLHQVVVARVKTAVDETKAYVDANQQNSSVGSRLAMWQFSLHQVGDAPWLGHGQQGWIELRDRGIAKTELVPYIGNFSHVHNEYLDVLLKRGVVGLALLLLLFLGPILWFFKPYLNSSDVEVKSLAMAGMVIPMMYMDFGLTQVFLSHNSGRMVLVSLWMCVAALLLNANEEVGKSHQATACS
jgi:O-antigen ligase